VNNNHFKANNARFGALPFHAQDERDHHNQRIFTVNILVSLGAHCVA